jgi:butyrate kinase
MKRIFAINLGSTSTKVAYYEDDTCILKDSIRHDQDKIAQYPTVFAQKDMRQEVILAYMKEHNIDIDQLDAFVTRGGQTEPVEGGVYEINEAMVEQGMSGDYGVHVTSVGPAIAYDVTRGRKAVPLTVDPPVTDEFEPLARYTGLPEIERISSFQALNSRAMAREYARQQGRAYEDMNLVVVMLGGGVTAVAHRKGRMIDGYDGLEGDGTFSNNRCNGLPAGKLVKLCFSGKYDLAGMMHHINGEAGLLGYLGKTDIRAIEEDINNGDEHAREVIEAMCYQTSKDIGAMATVLKGDIDAILLIGGMANSKLITDLITERVSFMAPVVVMPGEREMESLCENSYHALCGEQPIHQFVPKNQQ